MIVVDGITFPDSAVRVLQQAKSGIPIEKVCRRQVYRAHQQVAKVLPSLREYKVKSVLDIGCGLALGTILMSQQLGLEKLCFIDGLGRGDIFHDYREGAEPWNDVRIAGVMAKANDAAPVIECYATDERIESIPVDAFISFKSWGTHYPVAAYIPLAWRSLKPGGIVITDLHPNEKMRDKQVEEFKAAGFAEPKSGLFVSETRRHLFVRAA